MNLMGEEVLDLISENSESGKPMLKRAEQRAESNARCLRIWGFLIAILGFWVLLIPIYGLSLPLIGNALWLTTAGASFLTAVALGWNIGAMTMILGWVRFNLFW
jgi:hypothetical protein